MDDSAVRFDIGPEVLLPQCDPKESQASIGIETEPHEDVVEDAIGEVEGELGYGVEALEGEDTAYPIDELGSTDAGVAVGSPLEDGRGGVDRPAASERSRGTGEG